MSKKTITRKITAAEYKEFTSKSKVLCKISQKLQDLDATSFENMEKVWRYIHKVINKEYVSKPRKKKEEQ